MTSAGSERIAVRHRRTGRARIAQEMPDARILDVTSRGEAPWCRLSPMFPHGGIPVPNWEGCTSQTVEGIWQGLKTFENEGPDTRLFQWTKGSSVKRSSRGVAANGMRRGRVLGHQWGADATTILGYVEARRRIYAPAYRWLLDVKVREELEELRALARDARVVLLDYATNADIDDPSKPLSHAGLIRAYLLDEWPAPQSYAHAEPAR